MPRKFKPGKSPCLTLPKKFNAQNSFTIFSYNNWTQTTPLTAYISSCFMITDAVLAAKFSELNYTWTFLFHGRKSCGR